MTNVKKLLSVTLLSISILLTACATSPKILPIAPTLNTKYQGDMVVMTKDDAGKLAEYVEALRYTCTK